MNDRTLDRLFDRFRHEGDVAALGEVFDGTAPELLRVGMFLSRSAAEAEDLLQATFLTAIERAAQYDDSRALVPWLVGILANHARETRRVRTRAFDADRLERASPEEPSAAVEAAELERELASALASLPARDRTLLEAVLNRGQQPIEIARELGLAAGTVRMQVHRALERLRRALPASLALGGSAFASGGRGFADVRAAVLDVARTAHVGAAPQAGSASTPIAIGTALTAKNAVLALLTVVVLASIAWLARVALQGGARTAVASPEGVRVAALEQPPVPERALATPEAPETEPEARTAIAEPALDPLHAALTGIAGRLVEPDGKPAADVELALLEFRLEELRAALGAFASTPMPEVVVARTHTDADGRFHLPGARPYGFHALAGTTRNPRVPLRWIAEPLVPGATVDLGDVALPLRAALAGRVVDEDGAPVAGARVRAGFVPQLFLQQLGVGDLRPGGAIFFGNDRFHQILPVPDWALRLQEHLGLATTTTDADGRFQLDDVVRGSVGLIVDRAGYRDTATTIASGAPASGPGLTLRLTHGPAVHGRFLTADGRPIAGAEVMAGELNGRGTDPGVLVRGVPTDASGAFELRGVASGRFVVAVRANELAPWSFALREDASDVELREAPRGTLTVRVVDEDQKPVDGAALELRPEPMNLAAFLGALVPVPDFGERIQSTGPGTFQVRDLPLGPYEVLVRAPGHASASRPASLMAESTDVVVLLRPERRVEAHVVDDRTGEPTAAAFVVLLQQHSGDGWVQGSATTDAHGRAVLDALDIGPGMLGTMWLRTQFPGYAPAWTAVPPDTTSIEVRMGRGGAVHARRFGPPAPAIVGFTLLEGAGGAHLEEAVYSLRLDASGEGTLAQLTPGRWQYSLLEGWGRDASVLAMMEKRPDEPGEPVRGEIDIREGETTELVLGRQTEPPAVETAGEGTGVLHGTIQIDGAPARGRVNVQYEGMQVPDSLRYAVLDVRGAFEVRGVPAGNVALVFEDKLRDEDQGPSSTFVQPLDLVPGEERAVDLRYESIGLDFEVVAGEDEEPVNEASVTLDCMGEGDTWFRFRGETDRAGRLHVPLLGQGTCRIVAGRREVGLTRTDIEVTSAPVGPIVIALAPGVPCAGRVEAPGGDGILQLFFTTVDGMWIGGTTAIELAGGSGAFSVAGLPPGKYSAQLYQRQSEVRYSSVSVELGPNGDRQLRLLFQPFEGRAGVVER